MILLQESQLHMNLKLAPKIIQSVNMMKMTSEELEKYLTEMELSNPLIEVNYTNKHHFRRESAEKEYDLNNLRDEISMQEELIQYVRLLVKDEYDKKLLEKAINNINDNGYLPNALQIMSDVEYNKVLDFFKEMELIGVGCLNFKHSLALQAQNRFPDKEALLLVIENIESLVEGKTNSLKKKLGFSDDQIKELMKDLKELNPRPFVSTTTKSSAIIPDIFVEFNRNSPMSYSFHERFMPNIKIHEYTNHLISRDEKNQYKLWKQDAYLLLNALQQRKKTMIAIIEYLLSYQREAFEKGIQFVKPLTLKQVAKELNRHESTISRAISNKYVQTQYGVILLKDLFSVKVNNDDENSLAKGRVKNLVKEIIQSENRLTPLSDQKIATIIQHNEGLKISRRTVTKYREELNIASSILRKILE
ncbi:RNA polymerase factor sigma-54 [Lysinibacillus sp. FSL H8-0500]|uniref:RNA polymerase factor sigma-54 n=1 Tax=Lysinibacillus sp. FSL H8-0500 TaxID=2921393 RepID=UPI0031017AE5